MTADKYDELAARAERGELAVKPGTIRRGADAAADAQRALMEATGATSLKEATKLAIGRPPAGTGRGPSPVVRARVPQALKDRVLDLAQREQRDESDIVRAALAAYFDLQEAS